MAEQRIGLPLGKLIVAPQYWLAHLSRWNSRRRDRRFDERFGVDTYEPFDEQDKGGLPAELRASGLNYVPTSVGMFERIVRHSKVNPRDYDFVDLGSGKGRTLLLAAKLGFRSVAGVEADARLARIADSNVRSWVQKRSLIRPTVIEMDARQAPLPSGNLFVFMFHPFEGAIFERVAERLANAAREHGRALVVAYHNDVCGDSLERTGAFRRIHVRPLRFWSRPTISLFYNELAWKKRLRRPRSRWFNGPG